MASDESHMRRDQSDRPFEARSAARDRRGLAVPFEDWNTFLIRFPDGKEVTVVMAGEDFFA